MVNFTAFSYFLSHLNYFSSKTTSDIQILFCLKHSRALALWDEKNFEKSFKNKVSIVEHTDRHKDIQTQRQTPRQTDTESGD